MKHIINAAIGPARASGLNSVRAAAPADEPARHPVRPSPVRRDLGGWLSGPMTEPTVDPETIVYLVASILRTRYQVATSVTPASRGEAVRAAAALLAALGVPPDVV